jgi:hypothetical protein
MNTKTYTAAEQKLIDAMSKKQRAAFDKLNPTMQAQSLTDLAAKAAAKAAPKEKKAPTPKAADTRTITIATKDGANPKRAGTASHTRFQHYKNGMTVEAYVAANPEDQRRAARADIAWDTSHGHITLKGEPPARTKAAEKTAA